MQQPRQIRQSLAHQTFTPLPNFSPVPVYFQELVKVSFFGMIMLPYLLSGEA